MPDAPGAVAASIVEAVEPVTSLVLGRGTSDCRCEHAGAGGVAPAVWLPTPELRREREISRWRLHLVKHRSILKNRVHCTLIAFGYQVPMADLFGVAGRQLKGLDIPEPWHGHVDASVALIDDLERRIGKIESELRRSGADHKYVPT